ncbi:MAG: hypothetical protein V3V19_08995 [Cocleimonas sp.]
MGDEWKFRVKKSGNVTIEVNTRDDNGDFTSNLDPIAFLYDSKGRKLLGSADDNLTCNRAPVCGYSCPQIGPIFLEKGKYKIVVRDFNRAGEPQCNGGAYSLSVTGHVKKLKLAKDDKNVINDSAVEVEAIESISVQTTSNEKKRSLETHQNMLQQ